jgi:hypothetical protein
MGIFMASVFGATLLGKLGTRAGNIESALAIAAGTAALAALTRRYSGFPVWASIASVLVLAGTAIGGALLWPNASTWHHAANGSLWMHPWYFLTLMGVQPARAACATSAAAGWTILAGAMVIAGVLPLVGVLR